MLKIKQTSTNLGAADLLDNAHFHDTVIQWECNTRFSTNMALLSNISKELYPILKDHHERLPDSDLSIIFSGYERCVVNAFEGLLHSGQVNLSSLDYDQTISHLKQAFFDLGIIPIEEFWNIAPLNEVNINKIDIDTIKQESSDLYDYEVEVHNEQEYTAFEASPQIFQSHMSPSATNYITCNSKQKSRRTKVSQMKNEPKNAKCLTKKRRNVKKLKTEPQNLTDYPLEAQSQESLGNENLTPELFDPEKVIFVDNEELTENAKKCPMHERAIYKCLLCPELLKMTRHKFRRHVKSKH